MNKIEKSAVAETVFQALGDGVSVLGFEKVQGRNHLFRKYADQGCNFIRLKRVNSFSDWICINVIFGFNPKYLTAIYDDLSSAKKIYSSRPIFQKWIGGLMENVPKEEHVALRGRYNCFPLGSWEIRSKDDIFKVEKIIKAIETYAPVFFNNGYEENFFCNYNEFLTGQNHKDFIKLQIISGTILKNTNRVTELISYYKKRADFDPVWIDKLRKYNFGG